MRSGLVEKYWLPVLTVVTGGWLGYLVVRFPSLAIIIALAIIAIWAVLSKTMRPFLVGLLILAYMNAIPFVDLVSMRLPWGFRVDDVAMIGCVGIGLAVTWRMNRTSAVGRMRFALLLFAVYWFVTLALTVITGGGSPVLSALYGRDFLAITMSFAVTATSLDYEDAERLVAVLVGGACLYAVGHLVAFIGGIDTSFITHPYKTGEVVGAVRIFSKAMFLIVPAFMLALGRAVVIGEPVKKVWYWIASVVLILEIAIEMTRANYIGGLIAVAVCTTIILRTRTEQPKSLAAVTSMSAALIAVGVWTASWFSSVRSWVANSVITTRFLSASAEVSSQGGTFGYRLGLYGTTMEIVGARWLTGVGFWHPAEHYVSVLPQGSIRNADTGLLGVYACMGLIGVILMLRPIVMVFKWSVVALSSENTWVRATGWSTVGYVIWVTVTSFSLGFLSYGGGIAATAIVVGLMTSARYRDETDAHAAEAVSL